MTRFELVVARARQRVVERARVREVDHDLGIRNRLLAIDVEDADDLVARLARHLLDRLPHLAVAVNGDLHTATACSNSAA